MNPDRPGIPIALTVVAVLVATVALVPTSTFAQAGVPADLKQRAQRSLVVPATLLAVGATLVVAAPLLALGLEFGNVEDGDKNISHARHVAAVTSGALLGVGGICLMAYGTSRVIDTRSARRQVAELESAAVRVGPGQVQLQVRIRF